jgi:hypothetical protein
LYRRYNAARAFCLLFLDDYTMADYELPKACRDIPQNLRNMSS